MRTPEDIAGSLKAAEAELLQAERQVANLVAITASHQEALEEARRTREGLRQRVTVLRWVADADAPGAVAPKEAPR